MVTFESCSVMPWQRKAASLGLTCLERNDASKPMYVNVGNIHIVYIHIVYIHTFNVQM